jgi:hypothetical protein
VSDVVLDRIAAWESAGLIDAATAERLRAAEAGSGRPDEPGTTARAGVATSFFGPAVSIVEAFSYLGGAFVLAAWGALIVRLANEAGEPTRDWILVAGMAVPAAVFAAIGVVLHGRSPRLSRAAGVVLLLSVGLVQGGVTLNADIVADGAVTVLAGAVAGLAAALAYRWYHPSVLTQIAVLATITGVVQSSLGLINEQLNPAGAVFGTSFATLGIRGAAIASAAWLGCALVIGLIALLEDRGSDAPAARRAALTRFWAGVVAVVGVATAVMRTEFDDAGSHRVMEPWIADLIVLAVSAVLLERAFRRESGAYVLAAALGVVIALTDFNFSYFAEASGTEVALLVEGLLLIAIAFAAERVTRRVTRRRPDDGEGPSAPPPLPETEPEAEPDLGVEATSG